MVVHLYQIIYLKCLNFANSDISGKFYCSKQQYFNSLDVNSKRAQ